jgi:HPt (histidine-containing phosphotransfer) domain-containing protein
LEVRGSAVGAGEQPSLVEALNRLWARFRPQIEDRVAKLERAAAALAEGSLTPPQCEEATSAAHKLAGILGTFGLSEGTELAREMEAFYASGPGVHSASDRRPADVALQLRAILASRK